jgi:F420-non-reducing hydrogenase iron-sulfur subunit
MRVMCTGRVDMSWILRALSAGTDGILICGCHPGDCHYVDGNAKALGRVELLRSLLDQWRIERDRVRIEWVSSSESARFAQVVNEFVSQIRLLGPVRVSDASLLASNEGGLP